jgi:glycosyltransferase involved in cell wall biosynthesis
MTVLIINASSDMYGANRILLQTMEILKPRKIILIVPSEGLLTKFLGGNQNYSHVQVKVVEGMPVVFRKMNLKYALHLLKKIYSFNKVIKKIKKDCYVDWAYINTLSSFIIIRLLKRLRFKVLVHVHEILENDRLFTRSINRYSIKWSDQIIAVSEPVRLNLEQACKKDNIVTVLNGIDDMFVPSVIKSSTKITVSLFGRIKPEKGIWFFLDAIALLTEDTLSKAHFIIAGSVAPGGDHYLEKLKKDIEVHPARQNIEFRSFIPDIKNILNSSDIIVVPSLMKDPFPTTILEAASASKPVIATNTGGAVQSVKDNVTGFLISPMDTAKFAEYLQVLLESEDLRNRMGSAAQKFYRENFTLDIFKKNFSSVVNNFEKELVTL